jgi:hypothetical protein
MTKERILIEELIRTTKFTKEEARIYIRKAMQTARYTNVKRGFTQRLSDMTAGITGRQKLFRS